MEGLVVMGIFDMNFSLIIESGLAIFYTITVKSIKFKRRTLHD